MTHEEFMSGLNALKGGTGLKFDDPDQIKAWLMVFEHENPKSWFAAIGRCLTEYEGGFPQPAILKRYIDE